MMFGKKSKEIQQGEGLRRRKKRSLRGKGSKKKDPEAFSGRNWIKFEEQYTPLPILHLTILTVCLYSGNNVRLLLEHQGSYVQLRQLIKGGDTPTQFFF